VTLAFSEANGLRAALRALADPMIGRDHLALDPADPKIGARTSVDLSSLAVFRSVLDHR
jgi:hypothetical protein